MDWHGTQGVWLNQMYYFHDTLLAYPYFNKRFDIHTDARNYQLVSVISHNGKPIGFYSRKLTETKMKYTVT